MEFILISLVSLFSLLVSLFIYLAYMNKNNKEIKIKILKKISNCIFKKDCNYSENNTGSNNTGSNNTGSNNTGSNNTDTKYVPRVYGCMNPDACNYDSTANAPTGERNNVKCDTIKNKYGHIFTPEELVYINCEGECSANYDCSNKCGGTDVNDLCGICKGGALIKSGAAFTENATNCQCDNHCDNGLKCICDDDGVVCKCFDENINVGYSEALVDAEAKATNIGVSFMSGNVGDGIVGSAELVGDFVEDTTTTVFNDIGSALNL